MEPVVTGKLGAYLLTKGRRAHAYVYRDVIHGPKQHIHELALVARLLKFQSAKHALA